MVKEYKHLTKEQADFFLENGYVIIPQAMLPEYAYKYTKDSVYDLWVRLGADPNDMSTWVKERTHCPWHHAELASVMAPKAWGAICDLLGGEDRITETSRKWRDNMIVNLGAEEYRDKVVDPRDLDNWHVDGDFFRHFLDSPEQALLVIPLFADIEHRGGGTYIATDGVEKVAKWLADNPEGTYPASAGGKAFRDLIPECHKFIELTGKKGDVVLLHPLMLHSASRNHIRKPRFITNPPVSVKEPFQFSRENPDEYSLVELKTLKALGVDKLDFKPTKPREFLKATRLPLQQKLFEEELERLTDHAKKTGTKADSQHLVGEAIYDDLVPCGNQLLAPPSNLSRLVSP